MQRIEIVAMLMAVVLLAGCAGNNRWDIAYSVVDPGAPIDEDNGF